jgi:TubC N-terminal docking domain
MDAPSLLSTLAERGLIVTADGDAIQVRPRARLDDDLRAAIRARRSELLATLPRYRWRVVLGDGHVLEICCLPELTAYEVRARYPDAASVEPAASTLRRQATSRETAELSALIALVFASASAEERTEALTIALADPMSSIPCYKALAKERAAVASQRAVAGDSRKSQSTKERQ